MRALPEFSRRTRDRGLGYARGGRVRSIRVGSDAIVATVQGSQIYTVTWERERVEISGQEHEEWFPDCTCPVGLDCKHAFAVAAVLLGSGSIASPEPEDWDVAESHGSSASPPHARSAGASLLPELGRATRSPRDGQSFGPLPPTGSGKDPAARLAAAQEACRTALRRFLTTSSTWELHTATATLLAAAQVPSVQEGAVLDAIDLSEADPEIRAWQLTQAMLRYGAAHLPEALEPYRQRPDLIERLAAREREALRRSLVDWATQARPAARRSLRAVLDLRAWRDGTADLVLEVRLTSPRSADAPRTSSQLRHLRSELRSDPAILTPAETALLTLVTDHPALVADLGQAGFRLQAAALRLLLDQTAGSSLVAWGEELDPELARRGGVTAGSLVALDGASVQLAPDCAVREGRTVLALRFLWPDGRSVAWDDAVYVPAGDAWRGTSCSLIVAEGRIAVVASEPPAALRERFTSAGCLPLGEADRVPLLSALSTRWPHLRTTLAAHTRWITAVPEVTLDLRDDDWLQIRVLAHATTGSR